MSTTGCSGKVCVAFLLTGAVCMSAADAAPEVTFYLTLPLGAAAGGHVFGLRLDRSCAPAGVRVLNPESPLNRRPLVDLQLGANSALRLELARRLAWDIDRQELRQSARPADFTLRWPVRGGGLSGAANPVQDPAGQPLVKQFAVKP